jgi:hypothetical protein
MRRTTIAGLAAGAALYISHPIRSDAAGARARTQAANGTICIVAVPPDPDPRAYISEHFGVRLDQGPWVAVSATKTTRVVDLHTGSKHLVSIRDGKRVVESFWFRFDDYKSRDLCLWYKSWYQTWSLSDAAQQGRMCRCGAAAERSPA